MLRTKGAAGRLLLRFGQQVALSAAGTVVATFLFTGLQSGSLTTHQAGSVEPELTSGGKFAARVAVLAEESGDEFAAVFPPTSTPVLLAADVQRPAPPREPEFVPFAIAQPVRKPAVESAKLLRHVAHLDLKHRQVAEGVRDVTPPKRADFIANPVSAGTETSMQTSVSNGVWSSTKTLFKQAVWLGGSAWDRLVP
jgi:hypothetical protein